MHVRKSNHAHKRVLKMILHSFSRKGNRFHCSLQQLSADTEQKHYWALLTAQLSNETEHIIAVEHQRLCVCVIHI